MRVLLVHRSDGQKSGGGIAMFNLFLGLREAGVDSRILCRIKTLDSPYVAEMPRLPRLESQLQRITSKLGLNDVHLVSSFKVKQQDFYQMADVVDFHGIHSQALSYLALPPLTKNKPTVFTMHDMWAFTGHCAYSYNCERWKIGCGKCPYLNTYPPVKRDNTRLEWLLKRWIYHHSTLTFVVPSKWLFEQAKQSIIGQFPIYPIPNGVDTEIYRPFDPEECRVRLGIPPAKKVLMFVAMNLNDRRKGGDLLMAALQKLPATLKAETVLLTIGRSGKAISEFTDVQTYDLGYVMDGHQKAIAYAAADLFLFPTRADNLPLVLLESMACGTPMISFKVGGVPELVRPGVTGYLTEPENVEGFCAGIVELLENGTQRNQLSEQCRTIALTEYPQELTVQRYIQLYNQLLRNEMIEKRDDLVS